MDIPSKTATLQKGCNSGSRHQRVYVIPNIPAPESGDAKLLEEMDRKNYQIYQHFSHDISEHLRTPQN